MHAEDTRFHEPHMHNIYHVHFSNTASIRCASRQLCCTYPTCCDTDSRVGGGDWALRGSGHAYSDHGIALASSILPRVDQGCHCGSNRTGDEGRANEYTTPGLLNVMVQPCSLLKAYDSVICLATGSTVYLLPSSVVDLVTSAYLIH